MLAILAIIGLAILGGYLVIEHLISQGRELREENRSRAEIAVEQHARDYAWLVVAERDPDISDYRLDELTNYTHVTVQGVDREPTLRLVVQSTEAYGPAPASTLVACYVVTFYNLGTPSARYELAPLPDCPTEWRRPVTSPPASPG